MNAKSSASEKTNPGKTLSPVDQYWAKRLEIAKQSFEENGYLVSLAASLEEARDLALTSIIPAFKPETLAFGGSMTVIESGLADALLQQKEIRVLETINTGQDPDVLYELRRQAITADLHITSVNAATMDGKLVLLDGFGNRSAAVQFGPKNVLLLISRNKLMDDLNDALTRTKTIAAPMNALRLAKKTPCTKTTECMNCNSPERICNTWTIMDKCTRKHRIHIVLINQNAGF